MNEKQAGQWVAQELAKIDTKEKAVFYLASYENSKKFFSSEAGIASEKRDPLARKARHDLATAVRVKYAAS